MSNLYYKGYKVGSIEKEILKIILNVKDRELSNKKNITFCDIFKTAKQKKLYSRATKNLVQKGYLSFKNKRNEVEVEITNRGEKLAGLILLEGIGLKNKLKEWDNKWRIVIFDIPEKKKKIRDLIRFHLKRLGFLQIQGSVWIYPYPCEEIVTIIKSNFNLNDEIVYLTANPFEKDFIFRKRFKI